ncbi:hypothetical protein L4D09_15255 [Photobacterium makurazakiensis]|uniref:hypothetical protein n=1 Tax=Photobacterium makurazakiensis TaxID=2910234 RepID=UPI003D0C1D7C
MKKLNVSITALLVLFSAATLADIDIADTKNGSWITVSNNGAVEENASVTVSNIPQVTQSFKTNSNGRVFIPLSLNSSRSVQYKAITSDGVELSRSGFHSVSKR